MAATLLSAGQPVRFVLDCSVVFAWFFVDEVSAYADAAARNIEGGRALVPQVWPFEVASVLVAGERKGRSTQHQAATFLGFLSALPIDIEDTNPLQSWTAIVTLARAHGLSAYDAAYLELAVRKRVPLATLVEKLRAAAVAAGVAVYNPNSAGRSTG